MSDHFLQAIESEALLDDRFCNIKRIDPNGGNGYFSLLFTANDQVTGREVALKFFDPTKNDIDRIMRFEREGQILAHFLDEKYVIDCIGTTGVKVFNKEFVDSASGLPMTFPLKYIAMEKADCSIEDYLYNGNATPSPLEHLKCFKEMVKAVFRFHRRDVCHRDLKPSNFLVCGGQIKLSDLGTAKYMNGEFPDIAPSYTHPVGDMRYCSPELFLSIGIADDLVFLSDIFSLGAILFEIFTLNVLTDQLYKNQNDISILLSSGSVLSGMSQTDKMETFRGIVDKLVNQFELPNIFSFGSFVPNSISSHLNYLYKRLTQIDPEKRLHNQTSIHRLIDICILTLENEKEYQEWLKNKQIRRENRQRKTLIKLENFRADR